MNYPGIISKTQIPWAPPPKRLILEVRVGLRHLYFNKPSRTLTLSRWPRSSFEKWFWFQKQLAHLHSYQRIPPKEYRRPESFALEVERSLEQEGTPFPTPTQYSRSQ